MKIRTKLMLLGAFAAAVVFALVAVMYVRITNVTTNIANSEALATVQDQAMIIDLYINGLINIADNAAPIVANMIENGTTADRAVIRETMKDLLEANADNKTMDVYVGLHSDGTLISGAGFDPGPAFDSRTRPWYTDAIAARGTAVSQPYEDAENGKVVISISSPMLTTEGPSSASSRPTSSSPCLRRTSAMRRSSTTATACCSRRTARSSSTPRRAS